VDTSKLRLDLVNDLGSFWSFVLMSMVGEVYSPLNEHEKLLNFYLFQRVVCDWVRSAKITFRDINKKIFLYNVNFPLLSSIRDLQHH